MPLGLLLLLGGLLSVILASALFVPSVSAQAHATPKGDMPIGNVSTLCLPNIHGPDTVTWTPEANGPPDYPLCEQASLQTPTPTSATVSYYMGAVGNDSIGGIYTLNVFLPTTETATEVYTIASTAGLIPFQSCTVDPSMIRHNDWDDLCLFTLDRKNFPLNGSAELVITESSSQASSGIMSASAIQIQRQEAV